jgi:hypothetical protein
MLNRFRSEPPCFVVMLFGPGMRLQREIPLEAVRRLQLSTYFDGSRGPVPWADTVTVSPEAWWEVLQTHYGPPSQPADLAAEPALAGGSQAQWPRRRRFRCCRRRLLPRLRRPRCFLG